MMIILTVDFDTSAFGKAEFDALLAGGMLLRAAGLLNLKWEEFSALDAAREIGLHDVEWDAVQDDTPGSLTCVIGYAALPPADLTARLLAPFVLDYDVSHSDGDR